jgi:hypothetical protein
MPAPPVPPQAPPGPKPQAPVAEAPDATIEIPQIRTPKEPEDEPQAPAAQLPSQESPRPEEAVTRPRLEPVASTLPAQPSQPRAPINPFLSKDPRQKARRLARALVSDMIVYQPEKRQQALTAGNLKDAFAEEIRKSWEEYVEQVGKEMADSTPFFTDALNEILAGGQKIF